MSSLTANIKMESRGESIMNRNTQRNQRKVRLPKRFKKKAKDVPVTAAISRIEVPEENTATCQTKGCGCGN